MSKKQAVSKEKSEKELLLKTTLKATRKSVLLEEKCKARGDFALDYTSDCGDASDTATCSD